MSLLDWFRHHKHESPEELKVTEEDKLEAERAKMTLEEVRELRKDSGEVHHRFSTLRQENHFSAWLFKTPPVRGTEQ